MPTMCFNHLLLGFVIHGYLGSRTLVTKAVGLALSVASGLSLGIVARSFTFFAHSS